MRALSPAGERPVRRGPRAPLRTWALYFVWGAAHDGVAVDVGAGGAFIAAEAPPAEGTLITLRLLVPGATPFTVLARVTRRSDGGWSRLRPTGMGLVFLDLRLSQRESIERFIAGMRA